MYYSIEKYKEIITLALDLQLAQLKGGFVLDDFDVAVASDTFLRARLERHIKRKNLKGLEKMMINLLLWFEPNGDPEAASLLFKRAKTNLEPTPISQRCISTKRNVRVGTSGKGEHAITFVSIELPTGSGSLYAIRGVCPEIKAIWKDTSSVLIETPASRTELQRVSRVKMHEELINIIYQEV